MEAGWERGCASGLEWRKELGAKEGSAGISAPSAERHGLSLWFSDRGQPSGPIPNPEPSSPEAGVTLLLPSCRAKPYLFLKHLLSAKWL